MGVIRFGPSGNEDLFYQEGNKRSVDAPKWLKSKGLNAYEYSFGRGYKMSFDVAEEIGEEAKRNDVLVSVHAPYYINFANPADESYEKSKNYILTGLEYLKRFKGKDLVVHVGSCGKNEREFSINLVEQRLREFLPFIENNEDYNGLYICLETMGKLQQIGTYKEIIDLCTISEKLIPTFDFGHINALSKGGLKTKDDYKQIFEYSFNKLGEFKTKNCHIHFSKIEYGENGGEIRHLDFDDTIYGPYFAPLAEVIAEYNLTPTIICESKTKMMQNAQEMKNIYETICSTKY